MESMTAEVVLKSVSPMRSRGVIAEQAAATVAKDAMHKMRTPRGEVFFIIKGLIIRVELDLSTHAA